MKEFLTTGEVAEVCRLHKNTIIAALRRGMLTCSRTPGGHSRIPRDSVVSFMVGLGIKPKDDDTRRTQAQSGNGSAPAQAANGNGGGHGNGDANHGENGGADRGNGGANHDENGVQGSYINGDHGNGVNGRKRILIVEDNKNLAVLLQKDFSEAGYEVEAAHCGYDAGYLTADLRPDLILLDIKLPDLSGEEVLRRLKENERTKNIKVIVVSGYVDSHLKGRLMELGADGFVPKPFSVKDLRRVVARVLRAEATEAPAAQEGQPVLAQAERS
ncbi:MAG: response regulator [Planctomycetota bacterium]|nr:response regulator [Planctomycetota bacterium]